MDDSTLLPGIPADQEVLPENSEITAASDELEPTVIDEVAPLTKRPSIFISHKRDTPTPDAMGENDEFARRLANDLKPFCESIYLDTEMQPGEEYEWRIKEAITNADFFIVLISAAANTSNWIKTEVRIADECNQSQGKPAIIPIRLAYTDPYEPLIDVHIGRFNALSWNPENDDYQTDLLDPVRYVITSEAPPLPEPLIDRRLSPFVLSDSRRERALASVVDVPVLARARQLLDQHGLLWIIGDAEIRNYFALTLAVQQGASKIYEISKPRSWSEINSTFVSNSTIIVQDFDPVAHFEEKTPKTELASLNSLLARNNVVIFTLTAEAFNDFADEIRNEEFQYMTNFQIHRDAYDERAKLKLFDCLLEFSYKNQNVLSKQYDWVKRLLSESNPVASQTANKVKTHGRDKFLEVIHNCTPDDIDRFFTLHLRNVAKPNDFVRLFQLSLGGDEEIQSWFLSLDNATRCFVITVALFGGSDNGELWARYKEIVAVLRESDPNLAVVPMGIARQSAAPYVSVEGLIQFADKRIGDAVSEQIVKYYREYFLELIPNMKSWSVPAGRDQKGGRTNQSRKLKVDETAELRNSIARLIGKVSKYGFEDVQAILEFWASDPALKVREATAIALEEASQNTETANQSLSLLRGWCSGLVSSDDGFFKLYASASALSRVAAASIGRSTSTRALGYLKNLTKDTRRSVRFYTSIALRRIGRKIPLRDLEPLLKALAQDRKSPTRINTAQVLNEVRNANEDEVSALIDRWLASNDPNLRWVGICCGLISSGTSRRQVEEKVTLIKTLLDGNDRPVVANVFLETLTDEHLKKTVWPVFKQLIDDETLRSYLIEGLLAANFDLIDQNLLPQMRNMLETPYQNFLVELRSARWRSLETPEQLLSELRKSLRQKEAAVEVFQSLCSAIRPRPDGFREDLIIALSSLYTHKRQELEELLTQLRNRGPSVFCPFDTDIRNEALHRLFVTPLIFAQTVISDIAAPDRRQQLIEALELLVSSRDDEQQFLQALASIQALDSSLSHSLLQSLRTITSLPLHSLRQEFTFQLLVGELTDPSRFTTIVLTAMEDEGAWSETLSVLGRFMGSEELKKSLVITLSAAKHFDAPAVDRLLRHDDLQHAPFAHLSRDVMISSALNSFFIPKNLSKWFGWT